MPTYSALAPSMRGLAKRLKLRHCRPDQLTISRQRNGDGEGWTYHTPDGREITDEGVVQRLASLAMPPAYEEVHYAADERAHLQAVGRDAAGRLQYRYHPDWEKVREAAKGAAAGRARRSAAESPPDGHAASRRERAHPHLRACRDHRARLGKRDPPGGEEYTKKHGSRGAATLLKSNVRVSDDMITLVFRGKSGKDVRKEFKSPRLATAIEILKKLPGRRLFQYRDDEGAVRRVSARDVNVFLREIAGCNISLKDFRTLCASASVLEHLARTVPAASATGRRKQVREAVRLAAEELANTPAVCRRSYVHDAVVTAFEGGVLEDFAATLKSCRSSSRREQFLAQVVATASV